MTLNDKDIKLLLQQIKDEKDSKKKAFYKKQLKIIVKVLMQIHIPYITIPDQHHQMLQFIQTLLIRVIIL